MLGHWLRYRMNSWWPVLHALDTPETSAMPAGVMVLQLLNAVNNVSREKVGVFPDLVSVKRSNDGRGWHLLAQQDLDHALVAGQVVH
jgi:hypothetical protein